MKTNRISRRNFIQKTALTTGAASLLPLGMASDSFTAEAVGDKSSREIWIAGISQMDLTAETPELMAQKVYEILNEVVTFKPDFVVLPESFPYVPNKLKINEKVAISDKVQEYLSSFSKKNNCYTLCPACTTASNGKNYNSIVVFDRQGKKIGQYDKIHATDVEIKNRGFTGGALFQPVIQTEYGPIGVQICYDINWDDGWQMLKKQGARIIFWCSAFDGGIMVNTKAWEHKCVVASSTLKNTSKICDISGETVTRTGIWSPNYYCAPVNLEKVFVTTYDYLKQFSDIEKKYGRKVRFTTFHEEEWTIIESLSPDVFVKDIMKEFNINSYDDDLRNAEIIQNKSRL
jgi:beta-ureidopropionase